MSDAGSTPPKSAIPTAAELRMQLLAKEMEQVELMQKLKAKEEAQRSEFTEDFLRHHVSEEERAMIGRLVSNAVKDGKMEAMVYSFPSELCTDGGRAINSGHGDWPSTLQGKAKELYERYAEVAKPNGYRLKAMIINFPNGIPGDVGFFLNWAPEEV